MNNFIFKLRHLYRYKWHAHDAYLCFNNENPNCTKGEAMFTSTLVYTYLHGEGTNTPQVRSCSLHIVLPLVIDSWSTKE
jgi:hypothetical protein